MCDLRAIALQLPPTVPQLGTIPEAFVPGKSEVPDSCWLPRAFSLDHALSALKNSESKESCSCFRRELGNKENIKHKKDVI